MIGYRDRSGFDPGAYERTDPPLRPFNWVQWTGVGFVVLANAGLIAYFAGRAGLIPEWIDSPVPVIVLAPLGSVLVNSRRRPSYDPAPELASARKRWLIIIVGLCFVVFGAAIALDFTGA